jgi:TonB family protein
MSIITNSNFTAETQRRKVLESVFSLFTAHRLLLIAYCLLLTFATAHAQKVAVLTPEKNPLTEKIAEHLTEKFEALDPDLVEMAFKTRVVENIYNLTTTESKTLGNAVGCDFFIILKSENLRRTSFAKPLYFESYAAVYLVSTRTGRLVFWTLKSFAAEDQDNAEKQLLGALDRLSGDILPALKNAADSELKEPAAPNIEELPDESSPEAKNFKSPLPFKRMVPVYKRLANLYGITATVDALVDLDENGRVTRIEVTRWAGYELDESVKEVINKMQWRPAERDGKTLPIRVLLRYNFKKIEKDE